MKLLKNLTATIGRGNFTESPGVVVAMFDVGMYRTFKLCAAGLVIVRGNSRFSIPLDELAELVRSHEPKRLPSRKNRPRRTKLANRDNARAKSPTRR